MTERKVMKAVENRTAGTRDWNYDITQYNLIRESYIEALDTMSENYKFDGVNRVVDFGCGRGR